MSAVMLWVKDRTVSVVQRLYSQKYSYYLLIIATIAISLSVTGVLVYREREVLLTYDWQLRWHFIALACVFFMCAIVGAALLWADIMRVLDSRMAIRLHVRIFCISHIAKRLPGTVWYVASRSYLYKQYDESLRRVTIGTGLEFILIFLAGALVSAIAIFTSTVQISQQNAFMLAGFTLFGIVIIHPRCIKWLMERIHLESSPKWRYSDIMRWLLGYAILYILGGIVLFLIGNAVIPIDVHYLLYVLGIWSVVATLSILVFFLPSNFGFTEIGLSLLLSAIIPSSLAVLIAVMAKFLMILYEFISVGIIVLITRHDVPHSLTDENQ